MSKLKQHSCLVQAASPSSFMGPWLPLYDNGQLYLLMHPVILRISVSLQYCFLLQDRLVMHVLQDRGAYMLTLSKDFTDTPLLSSSHPLPLVHVHVYALVASVVSNSLQPHGL